MARNAKFFIVPVAAALLSVSAKAEKASDRTPKPQPTTEASFMNELRTAGVTPEERAIRIEQWQAQNAARLRAQANPASGAAQRPETLGLHKIPITPEEAADPLLSDIHAIESEIRDFQNTLITGDLSPVQRAIQIESFQQINREALSELEAMKRRSRAAKGLPEAPATGNPSAPAEVRTVGGDAETVAISREAARLTPEARAIFLESKLRELSQHPLVPAENPGNIQPQPQSTK